MNKKITKNNEHDVIVKRDITKQVGKPARFHHGDAENGRVKKRKGVEIQSTEHSRGRENGATLPFYFIMPKRVMRFSIRGRDPGPAGPGPYCPIGPGGPGGPR